MLKGEDHLTKRQYVHTATNTNVTATFTTTTTTSIATTFKAKGIEIKISRGINKPVTKRTSAMSWQFSRYFLGGGEGELNHNTPPVCRLSKGCNTNILGTVWCVKLKLTGLVVRDFKLTTRKCFHPNATASIHATTIVTTAITTNATKAYNTEISLKISVQTAELVLTQPLKPFCVMNVKNGSA